MLVGSGGSWKRRGWSAALGAGIPIALLVVYNLVSSGHLFHPGYQYLYELEAEFYMPLDYHIDWGIEDLRYLPQNFAIMFLNSPVWLPTGCRRRSASAGRCAPTRRRSAACSTPLPPASCRGTPG